jgi:hypothetical protein
VDGTTYRITVRGRLGLRFADGLEGMTLEASADPATSVLVAEIVDQAQLYGVIERLRDLGLEIVELTSRP